MFVFFSCEGYEISEYPINPRRQGKTGLGYRILVWCMYYVCTEYICLFEFAWILRKLELDIYAVM